MARALLKRAFDFQTSVQNTTITTHHPTTNNVAHKGVKMDPEAVAAWILDQDVARRPRRVSAAA